MGDWEIKYLAHYDVPDANRKRVINLAAANKLDYILRTLSKLNIKTTVISASNTYGEEAYPSFCEKIYDNITLKLLPTMKRRNKVMRIIAGIIFRLRLIITLLKEVKKGDTLVVYHSLALINYVSVLKKLKNFNLILEVEEIYGDMWQKKNITEKEMRFFKKADAYIFASELLETKINVNKKPSTVIYGVYNIENDVKLSFGDDKIHCVYAGSTNPRKGGALYAITAASKLPSNYVIHILSFELNENLKNQILAVNSLDKAQVIYEGVFKGAKYSEFLQRCDIGLSTQNPNAIFNDTSFPSKILSYLSNGLRVVSCKIKVTEKSKINDLLYYYKENTPESIAKAIMSVDLNDNYCSLNKISELDKNFGKDLLLLIKEINNE